LSESSQCTAFAPYTFRANDGVFALETVNESDSWWTKLRKKGKNAALHGTSVDIHQIVEEDPVIGAMHERAEKFDPRVEHVFGYLQVGEVDLSIGV
jgi:hypothetical protein